MSTSACRLVVMSIRNIVALLCLTLRLLGPVTATGRLYGDTQWHPFSEEKEFAENFATEGRVHSIAPGMESSYPMASAVSSLTPDVQAARTSLPGTSKILSSDSCVGTRDLDITQDEFQYLPNGMPIFRVTAYNNCISCSLTDIRIACGDWTSAVLVDPTIFRRDGGNLCLLNNGGPLAPSDMVFFEYSSTFPYPMEVRAARPSMCS